jgi:uncharacterized membrane protein YcaP (DUF421 family)
MDTIIRTAGIYFFLLVVFRLAGRRTFSQMTTFDLVVILIISETTQNALCRDDQSMTGAFLAILTLLLLDVGLALIKLRFGSIDKWLDGLPTIVVSEGKPLEQQMRKSRVDLHDILGAAREAHGLQALDQIRYAILEPNGKLSIVPWTEDRKEITEPRP